MKWSLLKLLKASNPPVVDSGFEKDDTAVGLESIESELALTNVEVPLDCTGFDDLPEHLLEKIFHHLIQGNRRNQFSVCAVSRSWRRIGQRMFFARPWEVPHIICHPNQLFFLSPRLPVGSRSGLLKCFVQRETPTKGGPRKFKLFLGKDSQQPHRARFLICALQTSRQRLEFYLNSACQGEPCGILTANAFASKYTLSLAESVTLIPEPSSPTLQDLGETTPPPSGTLSISENNNSVPPGGAMTSTVQHKERDLNHSWSSTSNTPEQGSSEGYYNNSSTVATPPTTCSPPSLQVLAELHYRARVKGLMQPRRMHVALPNISQLSCKDALPQLTRTLTNTSSMGTTTSVSVAAAEAIKTVAGSSTNNNFNSSISPISRTSSVVSAKSLPRSTSSSSSLARQPSLNKPSAVAAFELPPSMLSVTGESSSHQDNEIAPVADDDREDRGTSRDVTRRGDAMHAEIAELYQEPAELAVNQQAGASSSSSSILSRFLGPCGGGSGRNNNNKNNAYVVDNDLLQPLCLKNKAPHWNEGLRCWCLNFKGRVKLASVKNFQLVRDDDPREKVVMQFGKVETDAYVLDFNPTVLTAVQALAISLSTFNPKVLL